MTYACSTLLACPQLQGDLNDYFGFNPEAIDEDVKFLKVLLSGVNRNQIFQNQLDRGDAHRRQVQLKYQPRLVTGSSSTTVGNTCSGGDEPCNLSTTYEIDETLGSAIEWTIDLTEIQEQCDQDEMFFAKQLAQKINLLTRDIDYRAVQEAAALTGTNPNSAAVEEVQTLASDACCNGKVTDLLERVDFAYTEAEWDGPVFGFGGSFLWKSYWKSLSMACCNDVGENLNAMMKDSKIVPFYDRNMATYLTDTDAFLTFLPRSLQLITYNQHRGASGIVTINDDSHKRGVIAHPNPEIPLLFDYYAELSCNEWKFYLGVAHEVVAAPDDMFFATDDLSGVNGVMEFAIVNP